ncbi:MAG: FAD-dependent oxidoreductase, partial [Verrucomicrobia bacterium]
MNIVIVGAGAWGTAFALHLNRRGHTVTLVPRRFEHALALASSRENPDYLPGFLLPQSIQIAHELAPALMEAELVLLACPSQSLRETAARVFASLRLATRLELVLSLAKGLELGTQLRPTEVLTATVPGIAVGCLTGPTNAAEVAAGKPCAMVLAARGQAGEALSATALSAVQAAGSAAFP